MVCCGVSAACLHGWLLACIAGRQVGCQPTCSVVTVKQLEQHATAIPSRTYPFSSDQGSQTGLGSTSTRLSDRPGTLSAVVLQPTLLLLDGLKAVVFCSLAPVLLYAHLCNCVLHVDHLDLNIPSSIVCCSGALQLGRCRSA